MSSEKTTDVVTAFVVRDGRVLLLRRSSRVGSYQGRWAGVSGFLEESSAERQAQVEILEELGLSGEQIELERSGDPLEVVDEELGRRWRVHPFRFRLVPGAQPRLDWEHVELRWAEPREIDALETVPALDDAWRRVAQ